MDGCRKTAENLASRWVPSDRYAKAVAEIEAALVEARTPPAEVAGMIDRAAGLISSLLYQKAGRYTPGITNDCLEWLDRHDVNTVEVRAALRATKPAGIAWRREPPTVEEVRAHPQWWYFCRDEEDGPDPEVLTLSVYPNGRIAAPAIGEEEDGDVRDWRGEWAPCIAPKEGA